MALSLKEEKNIYKKTRVLEMWSTFQHLLKTHNENFDLKTNHLNESSKVIY